MASEIIGPDGADAGPPAAKVPARRARTAAQQREAAASTDPEVLAEQIERTREELAGTLDAIAEKVSPKKATKRTAKKATAAAKETAAQVGETVKERAVQAKEAVAEAGHAVAEKAHEAREAVTDKAHEARDTVAERTSGGTEAPPTPLTAAAAIPAAPEDRTPGTVPAAPALSQADSDRAAEERASAAGTTAALPSAAAANASTGELPSVKAVEVPALAPVRPTPSTAPLSPAAARTGPVGGTSTFVSPRTGPDPRALAAGAGLVVVVLWLLRRRRR